MRVETPEFVRLIVWLFLGKMRRMSMPLKTIIFLSLRGVSLNRVFDYMIFAAAAIALKALSLLPRRAAYALVGGAAKLCTRVFPWQRNIILTNLGVALPDLSQAQARAIVVNTFSNIGRVAYELGRLPRLKGKRLEDITDLVCVSDEVLVRIRALLARGKGLLYLTGHLGVWELLPNLHALAFPNNPLSIVVRPLDNPPLDRLVNSYRQCLGNRLIPKKNSIREILAALARGETVGILLDQNVCRAEGVFVDFFGKPACTNFGLAALALRTGTPVLPIGLFYDDKSRVYRVHIEPEVPIARTKDKAQDLRANTAAFTQALETMIRKHPDQWLWVHRRWKTRPADREEKIYAKERFKVGIAAQRNP